MTMKPSQHEVLCLTNHGSVSRKSRIQLGLTPSQSMEPFVVMNHFIQNIHAVSGDDGGTVVLHSHM